ncbi:aldose epimerase family protein [Joostella atrarenae]|nr:aldose epimerase family protein [Joostella atrarenae]
MKKYTIENSLIKLVTIDYGATIHQLITKDRNGNDVNVVISFKELENYKHNSNYLGASVGRFAGRIRKEGFKLNGKQYDLYTKNDAHLHGGKEGFSFKTWEMESITEGENPSIKYSYFSKDMEEGYPGNLKVYVTYTLIKNELTILFEGESDQDTVLNLTNHNYYNLNGKGSILDHELQINAKNILDTDENAIPTGKYKAVESTHYDFREKRKINSDYEFKGIDDTYVLDEKEPLAKIYSEESGIEMIVASNQPGVVVYTPETMDESKISNKPLERYPSICFETEKFSDSPNHNNFLSTELKKGEHYTNETTLTFNLK